MNELSVFEKYKQAVVSSRTIAECFNKQHQHVVQIIENLISENSLVKNLFYEDRYRTARGRSYREYLMNRDGFSLLVMGFSGKEALAWKLKYLEAFNYMERVLLEKQTADWQETRLYGKQVRLQEADAIKSLIAYAKAQGSRNADRLYMVYSKLVKSLAGHTDRNASDVETLTEILTFEHLLHGIITAEMQSNTEYKEIYQKARSQLLEIKRIWAIPAMNATSS